MLNEQQVECGHKNPFQIIKQPKGNPCRIQQINVGVGVSPDTEREKETLESCLKSSSNYLLLRTFTNVFSLDPCIG